MPLTQPRPGVQHVSTIGSFPLERVESLKNLGSSFTTNGPTKDEFCGRIELARSAFTRLKATRWSRREIPLKTKSCMYEALVRTILLYGSDNDCLRCIIRCSRRDRVPCSTRRQCGSLRALPSMLLQRGFAGLDTHQDWPRMNLFQRPSRQLSSR